MKTLPELYIYTEYPSKWMMAKTLIISLMDWNMVCKQISAQSGLSDIGQICFTWWWNTVLSFQCSLVFVTLTISGSGWCSNRALCDTNLKFGTMIEYDQSNIFRYRAIADSSCKQNGDHFSKWPPTISISNLSQPLIVLES